MKQAFNKCKNNLSQATILTYPDSKMDITTDASDVAIGAIVHQCSNKG